MVFSSFMTCVMLGGSLPSYLGGLSIFAGAQTVATDPKDMDMETEAEAKGDKVKDEDKSEGKGTGTGKGKAKANVHDRVGFRDRIASSSLSPTSPLSPSNGRVRSGSASFDGIPLSNLPSALEAANNSSRIARHLQVRVMYMGGGNEWPEMRSPFLPNLCLFVCLPARHHRSLCLSVV